MLTRHSTRANRSGRRALELPGQAIHAEPSPMRRIQLYNSTARERLRMVAQLLKIKERSIRYALVGKAQNPPCGRFRAKSFGEQRY